MEIADVTDPLSIGRIFEEHRPQLVFHAAAYKHVPLMERNPREAVRNNIGGTRTVVDVSVASGVERFVLISTDKAVCPTSVMGATKLIAEKYVQWASTKARHANGDGAVRERAELGGIRSAHVPPADRRGAGRSPSRIPT